MRFLWTKSCPSSRRIVKPALSKRLLSCRGAERRRMMWAQCRKNRRAPCNRPATDCYSVEQQRRQDIDGALPSASSFLFSRIVVRNADRWRQKRSLKTWFLVAMLLNFSDHFVRLPGISAPQLRDLAILVDKYGREPMRNRAAFSLSVN